MKLIASLDRACESRMRAAARPRLALLAIIGCAFLAPLLSGSAIAAATGENKPATMVASTGLLGALALTGPLREEDTGQPSGGGSDPAKGDDSKMTIGARLSAAIASKATLQAEIADLKGKLATAEGAIEQNKKTFESMAADLQAANAKIATLEADAAEVDKALKAAETEAKAEKEKNTSVEKKAQEKVAGLGFAAEKLPAADDSSAASIDDLRERMQASTDPKEKQALMKQIRTMRDAA